MNHLRLLGLLSLVAVAGCSQPSFLTSFADQTPPTKERINPGTIVRFSNSGVQVSLKRENSIVKSQVFDKVNMCLVEVPKECPKDLRGRVYRTMNLRTKETWSLANDIKSCG